MGNDKSIDKHLFLCYTNLPVLNGYYLENGACCCVFCRYNLYLMSTAMSQINLTSELFQELSIAAELASGNAYCPYSHFPVGASVLTSSGKIFTGCNVESASLGLTTCAERNAITQAVIHGEREIIAVVIYTPTEHPTPPCGACRQVIQEFGVTADIYSICQSKESLRMKQSKLFPFAFPIGQEYEHSEQEE